MTQLNSHDTAEQLHSLQPHPNSQPMIAQTMPLPKRYAHIRVNIISYAPSIFLIWVCSKKSLSKVSRSVSVTKYELCLERTAGEGKLDEIPDFGGARSRPMGRFLSVGGGVGGNSNVCGFDAVETGIIGDSGIPNVSPSLSMMTLLFLRECLSETKGTEDEDL